MLKLRKLRSSKSLLPTQLNSGMNNWLFYRGNQPHKSHKDPTDPQEVISVQLLKEDESRIETIHVHEDGTSKRK